MPSDERERAFTPSDFMRNRRPELFSDAVVATTVPPIDKAVFEFHLNTLTSRKDEIRFEHFCRKLAEKEICPNLLPQSGPTGGGDSKVDSETYPVDPSIALRWYHGEQQAATDRWAFAFSAKEDWRPKAKSDVEKIAKTGRGYTRVFFMTNQTVSDKKRAILEDELTKAHGFGVRILDRTWIVEKVFANGRWDVVYQTLDIDRPLQEPTATRGPLDTQRQLELDELDAQIADTERYSGSEYQLVEDCIQSALLARGLGLNRAEVLGRLDRAERLARNRKDDRQLFRVFYNRIWTAFWWFDDLDAVERWYDEAESFVLGSHTVWDLEKLVNLWQIGRYRSAAAPEALIEAEWVERSQRLLGALEVHASNDSRPTSALWARTEKCLMQFTLAAIDDETVAPVLEQLRDIVDNAQGMLDYPFDAVAQIVQELGAFLGDNSEFDELFETVMTLVSARTSDGEQGRFRLERGRQKLDSGDYYGAISQFARAQTLLAHAEHLEDLMLSLAGTALAYDAVGFSWAARASLIFGLDRSLYEFQKSGEVAPQAIPLLRKLVWLELRLGRVPCALLWVDMLNVLTPALHLPEEHLEELREERTLIDAVFCILVLRTRPEDWSSLAGVPAYLEELQLPLARGAALFALGHEELFRSEFELPEDEDIDQFFGRLLVQPAADELPDVAEWNLGDHVALSTSLLGCRVLLEAENAPETLAWAETTLGVLEAFFSTVLALEGAVATNPRLSMSLSATNMALSPPLSSRIHEDECGEKSIRLVHSGAHFASSAKDERFHEGFLEVIAETLAVLDLPITSEGIKRYFSEERAGDRATVVSQSIVALGNVLGDAPAYQMSQQIDEVTELLEYVRGEPWQPPHIDVPRSDDPPDTSERAGVSANDFRFQRHRDVEILSVINKPLWDAAKWSGTLFLTSPDPDALPVLALLFENGDPAAKILKGWFRDLGQIDRDERIRVSIITGVNADNPAWYRIAINARFPEDLHENRGPRYILNMTRFQEMTPDATDNLDRFLDSYSALGGYWLGAAHGEPRAAKLIELMIGKRELDVVPAWTIEPNSMLVSALLDVENPLVPEDQDHPPVWDALKQLGGMGQGNPASKPSF